MPSLLELKNIKRNFGAIHALKGVNFSINAGEIVGLVGENGAGKSTLVKILSGFDNGYSGECILDGNVIKFSSPDKAEAMGIAIAQQELSLIPAMSVAENIFLAGHNVPIFSTKKSLAQKARPFLEEVGLHNINPLTTVERLSVGEQHLVEVARLIAHDARILVLDEPTAALGDSDSIRIMDMVKRLASRGKAIIYVSHRLDEIFKICHSVTVLRDGESQASLPASELNTESLITLMLGRSLSKLFPKRTAPPVSKESDISLEVIDVWADGLIEPVSFHIKSGEILGLAGQLGSGSAELLAAIAGAHKSRSGMINVAGKHQFMPKRPYHTIKHKIAYCSEDRKYDGLFLGRPIVENLTAPSLETISQLGLLHHKKEETKATEHARNFTVDIARLKAEAGVLSGGNQQKVALGKWLSIAPKIILVNEPTRGVDVGAKAEIYQKLRDLADEGAAIVMSSTDILEITNLPDRVLTFYRGMHIGEVSGKTLTNYNILKQITDPFNEAGM
ncbi:MAG: sugar ABC transporter ATP-binding protein [Alphaproteobacteria bacterium]|nr:sugar ABC transporter ATP-binding protein [Alphaproteobacteria bacterium]